MKLMSKLLIGFLAVAAIVLLAGGLGIYSSNSIGESADFILDEKMPVKDVAMEAIIAVITGRDACGELMLATEGLEEIEHVIIESVEDFDMWISMITQGTESAEFKSSPAGKMYVEDGLDIVVPKASPEMIAIAGEADKAHEVFDEEARDLIELEKVILVNNEGLDEAMTVFDAVYVEIDEDLLAYEEGVKNFQDKDAAMEARVMVTKQKAIAEEYSGLARKDESLQKELREEIAALTTGYLKASVRFPAEVRADYEVFLDSTNEMLDHKEQALNERESTYEHMVAIDESSEKAAAALEELEMLADKDAAEAMAQADEIQSSTFLLLVVSVVVGFFLALAIGIMLSLKITKPLRSVTDIARKIADGDFNVEKLTRKSKDEIGMLAMSFGSMLDALKSKAQAIEKIAIGDLTAKIEKASDVDGLGQSLIDMNNSLNDVLGQVSVSVDQVSSGSNQVSQAGQALSQGATEQASSLEEISSSLNEINSQSKQNAESATEANALAKTAVENADTGNRQMQDLVGAMEKINTSSEEIKKVVKVIDDIAFQINLLALNANVEAARAGKYGKGFAVVAEEVRNLAVRSAEASKQTTVMVEESTKSIDQGTQSAEATAKQLEEIVSGSSKVADFLGEIALASKEQAQGVEQINEGLGQIDQVTQSNTASAEESASAAEELASQAQQLKGMISRFKLADNGSGDGDGRRRQAAEDMQRKVSPQEYKKRELEPVRSMDTGNPAAVGENDKTKKTAVLAREDRTGEGPVKPKEVIKLDDDDFDKF